ncbi:MAG: lyase [Acidimicrobiia bacterium]|nr:lyase [Acidimicrobiia bacterium]
MNRLVLAALALASALFARQAYAFETVVYDVPKSARPHDVAPAPDGTVWYTAQGQGALGILDPRTKAVRQVPLGSGSSPHGVIAGPDGNAWITDSGQNAIVRYVSATGAVTVWRLPEDTGYANLNTAAFDRDGVLWFTGQSGFHGRLDPKTGKVDVWKSPNGRGPYGIAATPDGEIWYVSLAGSYLAHIDRASGAAEVVAPPTPDQGARRIWSDSRGNLWVSEWNSGQLSRFDPKARQWKMWRLPGERPRAYAVYVDEKDIVWVSDFGANATLAFDPRAETFTPVPGSRSGAAVRQILGRPGEVWLPESGNDRLMLVRTGKKE